MDPLKHQIVDAWNRRVPLHNADEHTAYRVFHGAADGQDKLFIERFGEAAVISAFTDLLLPKLDLIRDTILELFDPKLILLKERWRRDESSSAREGRPIHGQIPCEPLRIRESGMWFLVEPWHAQNTGLFLDARPAREWLLANSKGRRVLNLFAYTGSLGVAAGVGGARSVTHVDSQKNLPKRIAENHAINDVPITKRELLRDDCYEMLKQSRKKGRSWDGIILDPPPRVPRKGRRRYPDQNYEKLTSMVLPCLAKGGWLLCFFNRRDVPRATAEEMIIDTARVQDIALQPVWRAESGSDFPEQVAEKKLRITAFERA